MRQVLSTAWDLLVGEAEQWQVIMLLADLASDDEAHAHAVELLEDLRESGRFPKEKRSEVRRKLYFARMREAGRPVPVD